MLRCVATDGHRLARVDAPAPPGSEGIPGVIVPRKTVNELRRLLEDDKAIITVSVSETKVRFASPELTLTSKVIDGSFPDYTRVIPVGTTRRLEVDAAEFASAVDRVATVWSCRSTPPTAAPRPRNWRSPMPPSRWKSASTPNI
jgi:DNA polymerase-3 subunit beta